MTTKPTQTADEQPHPFDPALSGDVRAYLDAWKADGGASYVSQGFFRDGTSQRLTVAQLEELLEQLAWHKQTGEELAAACARLRHERDDALAKVDAAHDSAALGGCPRCRRRVPLEHVTATASHCLEGTAIECTGTGLAPVDLATTPEPQTPDVWCAHYGVEIRDPDGWRTSDSPSFDTPITLAEFRRRFARSTARPLGPHTLFQIHARMSADLRGERRADG